MTSLTTRLQSRLDARPPRTPDPTASATARRILLVAAWVAVASLVVAVLGLVVDPRLIDGEAGWIKPAKFGLSFALYFVAMRWIVGQVHGHRRLLTGLAVVMVAVFAFEVVWIDVQVLRGTTSHFNALTEADATAFNSAGAVVSFIFMATLAVAFLALRTRGLDIGVAAGIRWGLVVTALGMAEAVSMLVNGTTATTIGGHTVGAPDGGPGLPFVGWSLEHGDLRIGHFVGLHAMQVLPLVAWALLRFTPLGALTRRDLVRVAGVGYAGLVVLVWWQAERGQALIAPDLATLIAAGALVGGVAAATVLVLRRSATPAGGERGVLTGSGATRR